MHLHYPSIVLVPDTFMSLSDVSLASVAKTPQTTTLLVQCIMDEFDGVPIEPVMRKYWSDNAGLDFVNQLMVDNDERAATLVAVSNKYYALSAASALFKHAELRLNVRFAASSLLIRYTQVEGTMMIDSDTARNLELVGNLSVRKSAHSLFGYLASSEVREVSSSKIASAKVSQILNLRNIVQSLPRLAKALEGSRSQLLQIIAEMISDARLAKIEEAVCNRLNEETTLAKVSTVECPRRKTFTTSISREAYMANFNRLLDVARETYKENVGDIYALRNRLVEEHNLPFTLVYRDSDAGFIFSIKKADLDEAGGELPRGFIDATAQKGRWVFSSIELSAGATIPNDVYCCEASSFQIVQGPNMSGKSTYLRQIALLTVMAMCGCFIPAEYGSFRIHDHLLTRLSNDDDLEKNLSTFSNEMASTAMILGLATKNSLVLIDEVGRGTSVREGVAISHAIAEELIRLKSFVFFATHFNELNTTLSRQPSLVK
uniref:YL1_C domain-containing protein n=1 Tax=Ganoderma boninense TaxID=34458 RepID=A0A5K1JXT1_9APHY|nr:YL1_C domain-containing protein [Ganoderma boninense]